MNFGIEVNVLSVCLIDSKGNRIEGAYLNDQEIDLVYMLAPMAINKLLDYKGRFVKEACPLISICRNTDISPYSEDCMIDPWRNTNIGDICPVKGFWRMYHLDMEI